MVIISLGRYLLTTNVLAARAFIIDFLSLLLPSQPSLLAQPTPVSVDGDDMYATTNHTLNFLQLAIRTCQRADPQVANEKASKDARNSWVRLCGRYTGGVGGSFQSGKILVVGGAEMKEVRRFQPNFGEISILSPRLSLPYHNCTSIFSLREVLETHFKI